MVKKSQVPMSFLFLVLDVDVSFSFLSVAGHIPLISRLYCNDTKRTHAFSLFYTRTYILFSYLFETRSLSLTLILVPSTGFAVTW